MLRSKLFLLGSMLFVGGMAFLLLRSGPSGPDAAAPAAASTSQPALPAVDTPPAASAKTSTAMFRISGRVEDDRGTPVRQAQLSAIAPPHGPIRVEADASGRFQIDLPIGGDWQLAATAEGLMPWEAKVAVADTGVQIVVKLHAGGQLAGQVRGSGDAAEYLVTLENESGAAEQTQSDKSGRYQFAILAPGTYRVGLKANSASWDDVGQVTVRAGERAAFDITVPATGGVIELAARLPSSSATARPARVQLLDLTTKQQSTRDIVLAADGRSRIDGISPGSYQLRVQADGTPPSMVVPVEVQTGRTAYITVGWGGSRVAGRVLGTSGRGAAATVRVQRVTARGTDAVSDAEVLSETQASADGIYSIEGLLPGDYLVSARGDGYVAERFQVKGSEAVAMDLAFPAAGQLEVSVQTSTGPVEGAVVFAVREPLSDWAEQGKTDASGHARITTLPAGNYRIVTTLAGSDAVRTAAARARITPGGASTVALFVGSK